MDIMDKVDAVRYSLYVVMWMGWNRVNRIIDEYGCFGYCGGDG